MKYIITKSRTGVLSGVFFSEALTHDEVGTSLKKGGQTLMSAGFVRFCQADSERCGEAELKVYGGSTSLGLQSCSEDVKVLEHTVDFKSV